MIWVHMFEYVCICMYICVNVCKCCANLRVQSTILDGLQGSFGGPWGVVLDSLWEADAPNVTHTDVSALSVFLCVSVFVFFNRFGETPWATHWEA